MRPPPADERAVGEAFWRFSLALYARQRVAEALIVLQDRAGCDVSLILFGLWLGISRNRRLAAGELAAAKAAIAPINNGAVMPLRRLRRQLIIKGADDGDLAALRRHIAQLELEAERRVQYRLATHAAGMSRVPVDNGASALASAAANLALCLGAAAGSAEACVLATALAALTRAGQPRNSRDGTP